MDSRLHLLGPVHLGIVAVIPSLAGALAVVARQKPGIKRPIARTLGFLLAGNELVWYVWNAHAGNVRFPYGLPLELSDLIVWLTVISMLTFQQAIFEFAWLAGVASASMAVLTPDLWAAPLSYPTVYFFVAHGGVIVSLLYLVWARLARPRPGCVWRALLLLNLYAALIGTFDAVFHTNYMYLCDKPASASLLSFFGPWPFYILGSEAAALVLFWLLWLPFSPPHFRHWMHKRAVQHS